MLVELEPGRVPGFFGLHRIETGIGRLFGGRKVDLVTYRSLNPHLVQSLSNTAPRKSPALQMSCDEVPGSEDSDSAVSGKPK